MSKAKMTRKARTSSLDTLATKLAETVALYCSVDYSWAQRLLRVWFHSEAAMPWSILDAFLVAGAPSCGRQPRALQASDLFCNTASCRTHHRTLIADFLSCVSPHSQTVVPTKTSFSKSESGDDTLNELENHVESGESGHSDEQREVVYASVIDAKPRS